MTSSPTPRLDRIDLRNNSHDTLLALIELLTPHIPYSLHILGSIINTGPRPCTLSNVDPSKVSLWSTIPLRPDDAISPTHTLFSIVTFSHLNHQFYFFCSGESRGDGDLPTEAENEHVQHVFRDLLDIVGDAHPRYSSTVVMDPATALLRVRIDADPPLILLAAVHSKWGATIAQMSTCLEQVPSVRHALRPPGAKPLVTRTEAGLGRGQSQSSEAPTTVLQTIQTPGPVSENSEHSDSESSLEVSVIRPSDTSFVFAASIVPRSDAYILSRTPYSLCLRERGESGDMGGRPVACALIHCDGSLGALRVDPKYRRQGLGARVVRALVQKLDFKQGQCEHESSSDDGQDLGGGALGWNWADTEPQNEAANRLFASLADKENIRPTLWIYMLVHPKS